MVWSGRRDGFGVEEAVDDIGEQAADVVVVVVVGEGSGKGDGAGREDRAAVGCFVKHHVATHERAVLAVDGRVRVKKLLVDPVKINAEIGGFGNSRFDTPGICANSGTCNTF